MNAAEAFVWILLNVLKSSFFVHNIYRETPVQFVQIARYFTNCDEPDHYETFQIEQFYRHPKYDVDEFGYDQMLVRFDGYSQNPPVSFNDDMTLPLEDKTLMFLGFGTIVDYWYNWPLALQQAIFNFVPNVECEQYTDTENSISYMGIIEEDMICAGGVNASNPSFCVGDSGGPLLIPGNDPSEDLVVGLASFNYACGEGQFPSVFSNVAIDSDWIQQTMIDSQDDTRAPSSSPSERPTLSPSLSMSPSLSIAPTIAIDSGAALVPCTLGILQCLLVFASMSFWL